MPDLTLHQRQAMIACLVKLSKLPIDGRLRVARELASHYKKAIDSGRTEKIDPRQQGLFDDDER